MSKKIITKFTFEEGRDYDITDVFPIADTPYIILHHTTDDASRANLSVRYMTTAIDLLTYIRNDILFNVYTAIEIEEDSELLDIEFIIRDIFNIRVQVRDVEMIPKLTKYIKKYKKKYNQSGSKLAKLDKSSLEKYNKEKNDYIANIFKLCEANDAPNSADIERLMREFINGDGINADILNLINGIGKFLGATKEKEPYVKIVGVFEKISFAKPLPVVATVPKLFILKQFIYKIEHVLDRFTADDFDAQDFLSDLDLEALDMYIEHAIRGDTEKYLAYIVYNTFLSRDSSLSPFVPLY